MTATPLPQLRPEELRPYASFGILQYLGPDESEIVPTILKALMDVCLPSRARRSTRLIAYGLTQADTVARAQTDGLGLQVEAFAYEESRAPSWATGSTALVDIENKIAVVTRRANLVAIHCPRDRVDALQVWLDNEPRPPFVRIAPPVLQQAILQGEARGLWLRGTHRRQTFKADTKNLSGLELRDALDPFDDSSFALTTGRATIPSELGFRSAAGGLGVTLRKSWVWNRQSVSLDHYLGIASEILDLVQGSIANGQPTTMFPELAIEVDSLDHVVGAFEAYFAEPEEVRQLPDVNEELSERAERLRDVVIDIEGEPSDARFTLIVGDAGAECGRLRCTPRINGHTVSVDFRTMSAPSNPSRTAEIRDAAGAGELLTVYYETGHSVSQGGVAIRRQSPVPFQKWKFCSFAGFDIHREKPDGASPQEIHTNVGRDGVNRPGFVGGSLGWVLMPLRAEVCHCRRLRPRRG